MVTLRWTLLGDYRCLVWHILCFIEHIQSLLGLFNLDMPIAEVTHQMASMASGWNMELRFEI